MLQLNRNTEIQHMHVILSNLHVSIETTIYHGQNSAIIELKELVYFFHKEKNIIENKYIYLFVPTVSSYNLRTQLPHIYLLCNCSNMHQKSKINRTMEELWQHNDSIYLNNLIAWEIEIIWTLYKSYVYSLSTFVASIL